MGLFQISGDKLAEVPENDFGKEKELQKLVETNLKELFGLTFISSELVVEGYRIDTLAYDPETQSFVILEYKRDTNFSVIDQGMHYFRIAQNRKADLALKFNLSQKKNSSVEDFDWSQVKVLFIAKSFTSYQISAAGFKDLPIELWEIRRYSKEILEVNQLETGTKVDMPESKQKISADLTKEVKTYTAEDHFTFRRAPMLDLYEIFRDKLLSIDSRIKEAPTKYYIGFGINRRIFCAIRPYVDKLALDLNRVKPEDLDDPLKKVHYRDRSMEFYNKHISETDIRSEKDISYVISLARQVFEKTY